jgi:hypothetical protein
MIKQAFDNETKKNYMLKTYQIQKIIDYMKLIYYKVTKLISRLETLPSTKDSQSTSQSSWS